MTFYPYMLTELQIFQISWPIQLLVCVLSFLHHTYIILFVSSSAPYFGVLAFIAALHLKSQGDLDTFRRLFIWHYWFLYHVLVCVVQAVIRVRFPDNYILEATFHPSETIKSLLDLLVKVIAHPELPFYICKIILNICYILLFPIFYSQEQFIIMVLLKI